VEWFMSKFFWAFYIIIGVWCWSVLEYEKSLRKEFDEKGCLTFIFVEVSELECEVKNE
jgi:hypothetical protein